MGFVALSIGTQLILFTRQPPNFGKKSIEVD